MLDIVNEDGEPTGIIKERTKVHEDGDLHRTSHVWIMRDSKTGGIELLLQKRSANKDSFPGCFDISSAGHIKAGAGFLESALRELKEELGIEIEEDKLIDCGLRRIHSENIFYGRVFKDNQVTKVYKVKMNDLKIDSLKLQKEEVESVMWMNYEECIQAVKNHRIKNCISLEELSMIAE